MENRGEQPPTPVAAAAPAESAHILVVGMGTKLRAHLEELLRPLGSVTFVADERAAWSAIGRQLPNLLLSDLESPDIDWLGLVRTLRADLRTWTLPIMLLSAGANEVPPVEGATMGADDYLARPFSDREIVARVRWQLELARERRKQTEALRESEEMFRDLIDSIHDPFYTVDADWRVTYANQSALAAFAKTHTQMMGRVLWEIFPETVGSQAHQELLRAMKERTNARYETLSAVLDRWVEVHAYPMRRGGMAISFSDITDRKCSEEALRASNERLKRVLEVETVGVMFWDLSTGRMTDANDTFLALMGYSRQQLEAGELTWQRLTPPEYVAASLAEIAKFKESGRIGPYEKEYFRADGTRQWLVFAGSSLGGNACVEFCVDISGRKRAEAALRESEERYRTLFESIDEGFCIVEVLFDDRGAPADYRFLEMNAAFVAQTGLTDAKGRTMREMVPRTEERWFQLYGEIALFGKPARFQQEARHLDPPRWYDVYAFRYGAPEKRQVAVLFNDVSAGKRAEEALRQSREKYQGLIETNVDFVWEMDAQGRYTYCSPQMETLWGLKPEDMLGKSPFEIVPPEYRQTALQGFARLLEGRAPFEGLESTSYDGRGRVIWIEVSGVPFFDEGGKLLGFRGVTRDVTQRKQAEAALRQGEEQFRRAIEEAPIPMIMHAEDGQVLQLSHTWTELTGYRPEDMPSFEAWLNSAYGEGADEVRVHMQELFRGARRSTSIELPIRTREGRTRYWSFSASAPGTLADGRRFIVGAALDITERKQAEAALKAANAQLIEADSAKNEFLGVLSHELRNPLAPIVNSLYILDHAAPGGAQAKRAKQVIARQVGQLSNLVNDLLDVTRITRKKVQLQKERLELNDLVRRAVEDHRSLFDRGGVHLELTPAPHPVLLLADATRLTQVIGNLLQNAAKFTSKGGHARVSVAAEGEQAVVRVADDGIGMARETLDRLFQPFSQAAQTLDRSKGGLGLGLALVHGLVELHGGSVSARSEGVGRGAEVIVRLPLHAGPALEVAPPQAGVARARQRVLIIEDNTDAADSLSEALAFGEHDVMVAYNGPEGLAKAREFHPQVVLCDIGLPGMDGYEVARSFRADRALRGTFLVALSGYALPEDLQRAAAAGFDRHLAKPPNVQKLEEVLASLPAPAG